uniref:Uncharacterized protein n=1 Tax=Oryza brachyantha TaxID=4533 RepID=J3LYU1_ORYBR
MPPLLAASAGGARDDVLRFEHAYPEVPQLRRHVHLRPRALHGRHAASAAQRRRVGVPRVREGLVGLRADPHREHDLPVHLPAAAAVAGVLEAVPLRRERAVRRHARGHIADVEGDLPDVAVSRHRRAVLVPDEHLEHRGLDALPREGEHLVPLRGAVPLVVPRRAPVVAELHFHVRVAPAGDRARRQPVRLDDAHVQVVHLLHEVVRARQPLAGANSHPTAAAATRRPRLPDLWLWRHCFLRRSRRRLRTEHVRIRHAWRPRPPYPLARSHPSSPARGRRLVVHRP